MESNQFWLGDDADCELSAKEKALRDAFVREYLKDYDPYRAAIRLGYKAGVAMTYATRFMDESYVQRRISELERGKDEDITQVIKSGLIREANYKGAGSSHSARVAAWTQASKIENLDKSQQASNSTTNNFVFQVPKESLEKLDDDELDSIIRIMGKMGVQFQVAAVDPATMGIGL